MNPHFNIRQYRILLVEGLFLSLTGSRGASAAAGEDGSRHLVGALYGLAFSTLVAVILYQSATPGQYLLVTFSISMIFTATAVVGELANGLFQPQDLAVTGHLPVSGFTRFAARFSEVFLLLLILTLNLNLVPAILFFQTAGWNFIAPLVCLGGAFCAAVFTAAACLVLYTLLARFLSAIQFQSLLLYLNIAVSLAILGLLINMGSLLKMGALHAVAQGEWPGLFPPAWFAGLALRLLGIPEGNTRSAVLAALALAAALVPLFFAAFGSERLLRAMTGARSGGRGRSAPGPLMRIFEALFVRQEEKAAFEFTAVNLSRDRGFRLKAYPVLGLPVLMMCLSLFEKKDPLFFIMMLYLMNLYLPLVLCFLPFGDHHRGSWIFDALPAAPTRVFSRGVEKAFVFRIVLPLFLFNAGVLCFVWEPFMSILHATYACLAGLFVVGMKIRGLKAYPFAREFRGVIKEDLSLALFGSFLLFVPLALLQFFTCRSLPFFLAQILAMAFLHKLRFALRRAAG